MWEYHSGQFAILEDDIEHSPAARLARLSIFSLAPMSLIGKKCRCGLPIMEKQARDLCTRGFARRWTGWRPKQARAGAIGAHLDRRVSASRCRQLATGYLAMIDGLWLSLLVAPRSLTKKNAKHIAATYLVDAFPGHRDELLGRQS